MKDKINFDYSLEPGKTIRNIRKYDYKNPVISIIIPIYNGGEYLNQTINSVLNQTYPLYEVLIIDDGSTDKNTLNIIDEVEKKDDRIFVYHKENTGVSSSRDFGAQKTNKSSNYFVFLDCDDLLEPTFLETTYFSLLSHPECSWAYTDNVGFGNNKYIWQRYFNFDIMKRENILVNTALIRKKDFFEVNGYQLREKSVYEDWNLWLKLLKNNKKPVHLNHFGFWYRRSDIGELTKAKKSNEKKAEKIIKETVKNINNYVDAVQYPYYNYNWDGIEQIKDIVYPQYKQNDKIKILMCIPWMVMGGADKFNLDLIKLIDKSKYEVSIIITQPTEYKWRQLFEQECLEVFDLTTFIDHKYWNSFINYLIKSRNIDIFLNTNSTFGYASIPYIKSTFPNLRIIDYIHMEEWYNRNGGYSRDSKMVNDFIDKTLFCNKKSEQIYNEYFGICKDKTETVYIGVDHNKFNPEKFDKNYLKQKYQIPMNKYIISYICRIDYQKRPYLLLKIIKLLLESRKDFLFLVVGDGPLLKNIKNLARKEKISKYIKFLGATNTPEDIYAMSDLTINCSIKEGLALTAYESLAMNVPVISSDVGGQSELINSDVGVIVPLFQSENEINNFDYSLEEVKLYTDGINKIISNLDSYKNKCRKRIIDSFSLENMIKSMEYQFDYVYRNPNKNSIENGERLKKFQCLSLELINFYFLTYKEEINYLTNQYRNKFFGKISDSFKNKHRVLYSIKCFIYKFIGKFHLEIEADMLYKAFYNLLSGMINFIKSIILFIKWILRLFIYILAKLKNIVLKKHN